MLQEAKQQQQSNGERGTRCCYGQVNYFCFPLPTDTGDDTAVLEGKNENNMTRRKSETSGY